MDVRSKSLYPELKASEMHLQLDTTIADVLTMGLLTTLGCIDQGPTASLSSPRKDGPHRMNDPTCLSS